MSDDILDDHKLYRRLHRNYVKVLSDGTRKVKPGAFQNSSVREGDDPLKRRGMSTQWCRHCTPQGAILLANDPENYGCVTLRVGGVREISGQEISYAPLPGDPGHTEVFGDKDPETRLLFVRLVNINETIWPPPRDSGDLGVTPPNPA